MQKKLFPLLFLSLIPLSSCWKSKNLRVNVFIEGKFQFEYNNVIYYLNVSRIDYETFILSNDKNVVEDDVTTNKNEKYYLIEFYALDIKKDTVKHYNYYNLHPASKTQHEPVYYTDDFNHGLAPHTVYGNKYIDNPYYSVGYDDFHFNLYKY